VTIHVGIVVTARWRSGLIRHATTRRRTTISSLAPIVELARWRAAAVVIATRAVASRRAATFIVVIVRSGRVAATATAHRRARSVPITAPIIWSARAPIGSPGLERRRWGWIRDFLGAGDFLTLELTAVQLLHCGLQIGGRLILDESSAVALTTNFGVDDVQSRLAGKVFQILPAGLYRKICYSHPVRSTSGARGHALVGG
jgi:hypothetical protein